MTTKLMRLWRPFLEYSCWLVLLPHLGCDGDGPIETPSCSQIGPSLVCQSLAITLIPCYALSSIGLSVSSELEKLKAFTLFMLSVIK